ncbi:TPA: restriction endonuclease subunit S [Listeria innocua]|uniref:restriction endonuclease subunit S n=1 Tax=Listeria innocua TaxID=1642 RepID=UPI001D65DAC3|nr:restriction endonuclease subunit S [Listeria innocua]MDH4596640.1 restriction endonuclease subunit S [Listeria innocua]HBM3846558.1 restriction endonuclease subunit S [Listeria innocua]
MKKLEKSVPVIRFKGFSEAWEQRKLGDHAKYRRGSFPQPYGNKEWYDGEGAMPFVQVVDVTSKLTLVENTKQKISKLAQPKSVFVPKGKVIVTLQGSIGRIAITQYDSFVDRTLLIFDDYEKETDERFWAYTIQKKFEIEKLKAPGGTIKTITKEALSSFDVHLPQFEEQQKIGILFKQLDDTIALHQRKLDALKLMKKAFSQQIFPENNRKKPKIRFTSFYEEWEQRKIGEYGYFYYGKSAPKWSVAQDATTPCVRYGELYTKFGPEIDIVHSYTNIDKSNLKFSSGNEVLVPRVGENPLDFANCSWLSISNVAIGEMISVYNTEQYPLFIAYYFRSKMKYEFAKRVEGGNVSNLYYSYLEDILISVPSIEEQKKIAEFLNKIDITINLLQNKLGRIKELKKAYLQNMFI